jgi:hypothetical protein
MTDGGGPLEVLGDILGEWEQIWTHAAQIQATFDEDIINAIRQKTTDPGEALRDHAAMLATFHPDVISYVARTLHAARTLLGDLGEPVEPIELPPRRRELDDVLDPKELTRRLRALETLVSGTGAVLIEARPRFDRRASPSPGASGDGAGR